MSSPRTVYAEVFGIGMPIALGVGFTLGWLVGSDVRVDGPTGAGVASVFGLPVCGILAFVMTRARAAGTGRPSPKDRGWLVAAAVLALAGAAVIVTVIGQPSAGRPDANRSLTPNTPSVTTPTPLASSTNSASPTATPSPDPPLPSTSTAAGWPTSANDGTPAMWAYFGTEFFFPEWVSCEETHCLAAEQLKIHVYTVRPIKRIRTFEAGTGDPYQTLLAQGFTTAQARALLKT
jgi:hypothetical protein